jgi:hypothetical protein
MVVRFYSSDIVRLLSTDTLPSGLVDGTLIIEDDTGKVDVIVGGVRTSNKAQAATIMGKDVANLTPTNGKILVFNGTSNQWELADAGTANAAGPEGAVQFNQGGLLAGVNDLVWQNFGVDGWALVTRQLRLKDGTADGQIWNQTKRIIHITNTNISIGPDTFSVSQMLNQTQSIGIGFNALEVIGTGTDNIGIGNNTLNGSGQASGNIALGKSALATDGIKKTNNVVIGYLAGQDLGPSPETKYNVIIGAEAGYQASVQYSVLLGARAGYGSSFIGDYRFVVGTYDGTNQYTLLDGSFNPGRLDVLGHLQIKPVGGIQQEVRWYNSSGTNYAGFKADSDLGQNLVWILPTTLGLNNYVLATDGNGRLFWAEPGGPGSGLPDAYASLTDGTNTATASGSSTIKFQSDAAGTIDVTVAEGSPDTVTIGVHTSNVDHNSLANLTTGDPHTQYQLKSEKNTANGYAGLDGSAKIAASQISEVIGLNDLTDVDIPTVANGALLYFNGTSGKWVRLPIGINGQVLTVSGGLPTWQSGGGGGSAPGGGIGAIQFNLDNVNFGGDETELFWDNTNKWLGIGVNTAPSPIAKVTIRDDIPLRLEASSDPTHGIYFGIIPGFSFVMVKAFNNTKKIVFTPPDGTAILTINYDTEKSIGVGTLDSSLLSTGGIIVYKDTIGGAKPQVLLRAVDVSDTPQIIFKRAKTPDLDPSTPVGVIKFEAFQAVDLTVCELKVVPTTTWSGTRAHKISLTQVQETSTTLVERLVFKTVPDTIEFRTIADNLALVIEPNTITFKTRNGTKNILTLNDTGTDLEVLPHGDGEGNIGKAGKRWALVKAVTVEAGDVKFSNGWYLTETENGIALCRPDGSIAQQWN